jgi:transcriptional regulator with XRE-family HTH domain
MDESVAHAVRIFLADQQISLRTLAARAGVSHSTLSRILQGKQEPTADTVRRIEAALAASFAHPQASAETLKRQPGRAGLLGSAGEAFVLLLPVVLGALLWWNASRQRPFDPNNAQGPWL